MLRRWLEDPLTRGLEIDHPTGTALRQRLIQKKRLLRLIYKDWYAFIASEIPAGSGAILELGSGPGFLKEHIPDLITSDVFPCSGVKLVLDGECLPFADDTLRAIVMTDVLHHLQNPRRFFKEASRCVEVGGRVIMIEPWVSQWSTLIYSRFHHEPFCPEAADWEFPTAGPLSGANGALPWILFSRDRKQFEGEFPQWRIQRIAPDMPFSYLFSGGVSLRSLAPGGVFKFLRWIESKLQPWMESLAMFAAISLVKIGPHANAAKE